MVGIFLISAKNTGIYFSHNEDQEIKLSLDRERMWGVNFDLNYFFRKDKNRGQTTGWDALFWPVIEGLGS